MSYFRRWYTYSIDRYKIVAYIAACEFMAMGAPGDHGVVPPMERREMSPGVLPANSCPGYTLTRAKAYPPTNERNKVILNSVNTIASLYCSKFLF